MYVLQLLHGEIESFILCIVLHSDTSRTPYCLWVTQSCGLFVFPV